MQFSIRDVLWLTVVVGLAIALVLQMRADPPPASPAQPAVGRYQVLLDKEGRMVMVDTATGEYWVNTVSFGWTRVSPPIKK